MIRKVLVTGGAGYVGAALVPKLLESGYQVKVIDLMIYGEHVLNAVKENPNLNIVKGDIRDFHLLKNCVRGMNSVIHLACISNDPSFELNPQLGKSINYDAFKDLVMISEDEGVDRFIYASSSSVYGIKEELEVTEDLFLEPLTDYSKYKALCEEILLSKKSRNFIPVVIRPATVCGYSPRIRLDLTVNILTNHAINKGEITVFGGEQKRPNIHIDDMTNLYCMLLELPKEMISGKIYNAGYQNYKLSELAEIVKNIIGHHVNVVTTPSNDLRSYHVSSEKIKREIGFVPENSIEDAVNSLKWAFGKGLIPDPLENKNYYNVKKMLEIKLH